MIIMDVEKYKEMTAPCFRDADPPCTDLCPLGMDVRKFISKMKAGKYKAAYRVFRPKAVFPGIVSALCPAPCMKGCTRAAQGKDPVRMRELEAFCFEQAVSKPERYRLAKKEQSVAVIGGGLCGLSCAYRLASRGYHITVFERSQSVGGRSLTLMDPGKALEDIRREFSELDVCTFETGHEVDDRAFEELTDAFSAVFLATGEKGALFGLSVRDTYKTDRPGVFAGGLLTGEKDQIEAMADGFNAAEYIELYFQLGADALPDFPLLGSRKPDERFYGLHFREEEAREITGAAPAGPEDTDTEVFDAEAEAVKCYECNCSECYDVCSLMQKVKKYPKKIASDTIGTLRPNKYSRPAVRMLMGCTFCGKCKEVCPAGIDMGNLFRLARRDFYEDETMPESFHEYWMADMDFSLSGETSTLHTPDPASPSEYVFFPGCQLTGMSPDVVENAYAFIRSLSENTSLYLGCCGVPAEWAGAEDKRKEAAGRLCKINTDLGSPTFILACTACKRNLAEYCPELKTISLYSFMQAHAEALPQVSGISDPACRIFDPCGAAKDPETRDAVRALASRAGLCFEETDALPGCCGFGGHIYPADPPLQQQFADAGAGESEKPLVTYCANCNDTFRKKGHESFHLLDLYFGYASRPLPTLGERRDNRRMLKQKICSEKIMPYPYAPGLVFTREALDKMQKSLITEENIDEVLQEAPVFSDADSGLLYARKQIGKITLWAVYREGSGQKIVSDVYKYRMEVLE